MVNRESVKAFARACLDDNTKEELERPHQPEDANSKDLDDMCLTAEEWSLGIEIARTAMEDGKSVFEIMNDRHDMLRLAHKLGVEI